MMKRTRDFKEDEEKERLEEQMDLQEEDNTYWRPSSLRGSGLIDTFKKHHPHGAISNNSDYLSNSDQSFENGLGLFNRIPRDILLFIFENVDSQ